MLHLFRFNLCSPYTVYYTVTVTGQAILTSFGLYQLLSNHLTLSGLCTYSAYSLFYRSLISLCVVLLNGGLDCKYKQHNKVNPYKANSYFQYYCNSRLQALDSLRRFTYITTQKYYCLIQSTCFRFFCFSKLLVQRHSINFNYFTITLGAQLFKFFKRINSN